MAEPDSMVTLIRRQTRNFELAHREPCELKCAGFALKRQGIDLSRRYCDLRYLLLPWDACPRLSTLSPDQASVLTASFFGLSYAEIASAETVAIRNNLRVSEAMFEPYSDAYMVLFHETAEEFDHITAFRAVCAGLLGRGDAVGPDNFPHLKPYDGFAAYRDRLGAEGFAALGLLMRYLQNIGLKQLEGFFTAGMGDTLDPLAAGIVTGHARDEGRHMVTSLNLGLEVYARAPAAARKRVADMMRLAVYTMIDQRFGPLGSSLHRRSARRAVTHALEHEVFDGFGTSAASWFDSWDSEGLPIVPSEGYLASQRWVAKHLARLVNGLDLSLTPRGEAFDRFVLLARSHLGHRTPIGPADAPETTP